MDSLVTAAAHALAVGDPLGALKRVALRDDAPALALRGIALAQLGDFTRARTLLRRAARAFGAQEVVARARCVVAEAEVALASRDLAWPTKSLAAARATLEAHGDRVNAAHARYLEIHSLLLIGRIEAAERMIGTLAPSDLPFALRASHELAIAGIALRRVRAGAARTALQRAAEAARRAGIPALAVEVDRAICSMNDPAARLITHDGTRLVLLDDVEALLASKALVVDACRYMVRDDCHAISLAKRPVLFALARALGEAWPHGVPRDVLVSRVFRLRLSDESHRARLRVEVGRLRKAIRTLASVHATPRGFALATTRARKVVVLARPVEEKHAAVLALLADGESWSSSALALALGASQRNTQRALDALAATGKATSLGRGRARRWMTPPLPGFMTTLLLPGPLPGD